MNNNNKKEQTHRYREQSGEGERQGRVGASRHKLLGIKQIRYKDILYSTRRQPMFYNNFKCSKILQNFETLCCTAETYIIKLRSFRARQSTHGEYEVTSAAKQHFTQNVLPPPTDGFKKKKFKTTVTIKKKKPGHFFFIFKYDSHWSFLF